MYFGYADCFGLAGPATENGQLFVFWIQPVAGFSTFGLSSSDVMPR